MPRKLLPLVALLVLLCALPIAAQPDAPQPLGEEGEHDAHALVGTWMGLTMDGEALEEGEFVLVFNADGTGSIIEGGDDPEPYTYTYDADTAQCVIFFDGDEDDGFPIDVTIDGDTATFAPTQDDDVLVARRVGADGDGGGNAVPMPEPADMSDSPLVGRWTLVSFNGEAMPEGTVYVFENHPDGTGTSTINGEPADPYTWHHDFDTGVATFTHPGQDPAAFTFDIEGDVATYVSTDGALTIIERRLGPGEAGDAFDEEPPNGVPAPEPEPVDMSDSPLVGRWMLVQFNGEQVPADVVVYDHHADGTGTVIESGEEGDTFLWRHNLERGTIFINAADNQTYEFIVVMQDDLVFYVSEDLSMRIVHQRVEGGGVVGEADELVGTWHALSMGGEPMEPGQLSFVFNDDGTGELLDGNTEPFTYAYNSATKLYSIQVEEEDPIIFDAEFDGDRVTITPVDEDGPPAIVLQRAADDDADHTDGAGAMDEDGVVGTWYAQKMEGEWVPADDEFRIEFREDGTAHAFDNGEPEDDGIFYTVDEERSRIQIFERPGGEMEIELAYELFDDVMVLTFQLSEGINPGDGLNAEDMTIVLCRRPEGNELHQRERAAAHPDGDGAGIGRDVEDAGGAIEDAARE